MAGKQKLTGRAMSMPGGLAFGAAVSLGLTLLGALLLAKLVQNETLPWENIGYGIMVMLLAASFSGAMLAAARIKRQRLTVCLLSGVIYFGLLLSMTALFFGGQYSSVGVTGVLILGGSGTAALLGIREKRGGKPRKIKVNHR